MNDDSSVQILAEEAVSVNDIDRQVIFRKTEICQFFLKARNYKFTKKTTVQLIHSATIVRLPIIPSIFINQ